MATTEIQGMLAKLLATENLIVEHRQVSTASFDIDRRLLTLPIWEGMKQYVYDMLVAHEVGHALFTELREWSNEEEYKDVPFSYVNIVEDARIEKLMKKRYPGLTKDFHRGYRDMNEKDFFELNGKDVNELSYIDRVNLYFKVGSFYDIEFNDAENDIVTRISNAETFEDVLVLAKAAYALHQEQMEKQTQTVDVNIEGNTDGQSDTHQQPQENEQQSGGEENADVDDKSDESDELEGDVDEMGGSDSNIDDAQTQRSFDRNLEDLRNQHATSPTYVTLPDIDLDKVIVPIGVVSDRLESHFSLHTSDLEDVTANWILGFIDDYKEYKTSSSKEVNTLVKEFEMRKSADAYARTSVARTGVLDTAKLHTYKYNEDVFRKVSTTTDGKNHSLVFVLDWSGSMAHEMMNTIKQLFQLVWFCRKVNIPFEVYAFTNEAWVFTEQPEKHMNCEWKKNDLSIHNKFRMVNIISSKMKSKDFDNQLKNLWLTAHSFTYNIPTPHGMTLSGTPINEAIICAGKIAKKFQKETNTQKCNIVFLTDGEGNHSGRNVIRTGYDDIERQCAVMIRFGTIIRHKSHTFECGSNGPSLTDALVRAIKVDNINCNVMSFRVFQSSDMISLYRWYGTDAYDGYDDMKNELRKHGSVSFKGKGFDRWFGIPIKSLATDTEFEVDSDKKSDVSKAFRKMYKNKKGNKYITKAFMEQVA